MTHHERDTNKPQSDDLDIDLTDPAQIKLVSQLIAQSSQQHSKPQQFRQDLRYTHERMYRAISDVVVGSASYLDRLACAQRMMVVLTPADFPPDLCHTFRSAMKKISLLSQPEAKALVRDLIGLFLTLSERVVSGVTMGDDYEKEAWMIRQAQEGRPEPLIQHINRLTTKKQPLSKRLVAYYIQLARARASRRGQPSVHPARRVAIARMVKDRLEFLRLENPKVTLKAVCQSIASLVEPEWSSVQSYYNEIYGSRRRR